MRAMEILAHRANHAGPDKERENTQSAFKFCLRKGWGIETDIRRTKRGKFYISHDERRLTRHNHADQYMEIIRAHRNVTIALNIKELGHEKELIEYLCKMKVEKQMFLFDMELIESIPGATASLFRRLHKNIKIAARISDRKEPIERALSIGSASIIWLDEFEKLWVEEEDIKKLKKHNKVVYAISPEIHGFSLEDMRRRWRQFSRWGVDGICTDYSTMLANEMRIGFRESVK